MTYGSLLSLPEGWTGTDEFVEILLITETIRLERIISKGHATLRGEWYDQLQDEWVALLQGEARLAFDDGVLQTMHAGDWAFISAHRRHRVEFTSIDPPCIWLAFHGSLR
jgi:cupin 2 domain-containing protein